MDMIKYQFADPQEIADLKNQQFTKLLKDKIYSINPNFIKSEECMERLIDHLLILPIGKQTLKLVSDLVKYFQSPILYSLRQFYSKHKKYFKNLSKSQKQASSLNSQNKQLKLLQQIGSFYQKLTSEQQEIEELSFFTQYGVANKDVNIIKKDEQYQQKYLRWLKKSLVSLQVLKKQPPTQKTRLNWIERTQKEFNELVKNRSAAWLQRFSIEDIINQCQDIPDFHKNISKRQTNDNQSSNKNINSFNIKSNDSLNKLEKKESSQQKIYKNVDSKCQVQNLSHISPCLRRFFYENQNLWHAEDINLQYKNFKAPYDKYCVQKLRRAICGFLNRGGGVIFVGIKEDINDKSRIVKGQILSEYKKQEVLFEYKYICQQIQPDIISQAKYHVKFVPIKKKNGNYIQGKYVVRLQVAKGDNKCFYTINQNNQDFVVLRTGNEVLRRGMTQKTLANFKMRLLNPPNHPPLPPCPEPEIGIPLLQDKHQTWYNQRYEYSPDQDQYQEHYKNPYYQNPRKWKLKTDPVSPPTSQIKPKDFVYFNPTKTQANDLNVESKNDKTKKKFICDEQENQDNMIQKESKIQQQQKFNNILSQVNNSQKNYSNGDMKKKQQNQQDDLDFQPINAVLPKKQYKQNKQSKQFYQPFQRKENKVIPKPDVKKYQTYEVDRASLSTYTEKPSSLDILVIGLPFVKVNQIAKQANLPLIQPPILCNNDYVTWLSINSRQFQTNQKINQFMHLINKQWMGLPQGKQKKKIKVRKLFSNVYFQDDILLNKFIHKFGHNQEFCDQRGIYYYACKDKQQAILAYIIGYELNIKIKFISSQDLKAKKLEFLKSKVQRRERERNQHASYHSDFL